MQYEIGRVPFEISRDSSVGPGIGARVAVGDEPDSVRMRVEGFKLLWRRAHAVGLGRVGVNRVRPQTGERHLVEEHHVGVGHLRYVGFAAGGNVGEEGRPYRRHRARSLQPQCLVQLTLQAVADDPRFVRGRFPHDLA